MNETGGRPFSRGHLYRILTNPIYAGKIAHKGQHFEGHHPPIIAPGIWQAVQDRMSSNRRGHRAKSNTAQPSLLAGLVLDEDGHRLTPSHSKKGTVRYRYYVERRRIEGSRDGALKALRIPAQELEDAVVRATAAFLSDETRVLQSIGSLDAEPTQRALVRAKKMGRSLLDGSMGGSTVADCIKQVRVGLDRISIELQPSAVVGEQGSDHPPVVIDMPMQMKRCGQAVRLVVLGPGLPQNGTPDPKLIALLARAHDWFGRLSSGQDVDVSSIAAASGFSASYVTRVMYLAFLAPEIVRRIVKGDHPPGLGTDRLMRSVPLPLSWAEQRSALGFDR